MNANSVTKSSYLSHKKAHIRPCYLRDYRYFTYTLTSDKDRVWRSGCYLLCAHLRIETGDLSVNGGACFMHLMRCSYLRNLLMLYIIK